VGGAPRGGEVQHPNGWRVLWPGGGEDGLVVHQAAVRAAGVQGLAL
jgi:hypothetical protein